MPEQVDVIEADGRRPRRHALARRGRWQGRAVRDVCRGGMRIGATGDKGFVATALDEIRVKLK